MGRMLPLVQDIIHFLCFSGVISTQVLPCLFLSCCRPQSAQQRVWLAAKGSLSPQHQFKQASS